MQIIYGNPPDPVYTQAMKLNNVLPWEDVTVSQFVNIYIYTLQSVVPPNDPAQMATLLLAWSA